MVGGPRKFEPEAVQTLASSRNGDGGVQEIVEESEISLFIYIGSSKRLEAQ